MKIERLIKKYYSDKMKSKPPLSYLEFMKLQSHIADLPENTHNDLLLNGVLHFIIVVVVVFSLNSFRYNSLMSEQITKLAVEIDLSIKFEHKLIQINSAMQLFKNNKY